MNIKSILAALFQASIFFTAVAQNPQPAAAPQQTQNPVQTQNKDIQDDVVKITTNLVQVDAVVTKNGKPIRDLKAGDFEIYEDGHKQQISSFARLRNETLCVSSAFSATLRLKCDQIYCRRDAEDAEEGAEII